MKAHLLATLLVSMLVSCATCQQTVEPKTEGPKPSQVAEPALSVDHEEEEPAAVETTSDSEEAKSSTPEPTFELYYAAGGGDLDKTRELLAANHDVNQALKPGCLCTPLMIAAQEGHQEVVQTLLDHGADVNQVNIYGDRAINHAKPHPDVKTLLEEAGSLSFLRSFEDNVVGALRRAFPDLVAKMSDDEIRRVMQSAHALAEKKQVGFTRETFLLTLAQLVFDKSPEQLATKAWFGTTLLNRWAKPRTNRFKSALRKRHPAEYRQYFVYDVPLGPLDRFRAAARRNLIDEMRRSLDHGFEPDNRIAFEDDTPLGVAAHHGHVRVMELLIERGANPNVSDKNGFTPLHGAAQEGWPGAVALLLGAGANVNTRSSAGYTPKDMALRKNNGSVLAHLDRAGATTNQTDELPFELDATSIEQVPGKRKNDALKAAIMLGKKEWVARLLDKGGSPNAQRKRGDTPLGIAAELGHLEIVNLLLAKGAKTNPRGFLGYTALHNAAMKGRQQILELLLEQGADPNARTKRDKTDRVTPLMWAATNGHADAVLLLLERGADPNTRYKGATALIYAARDGRQKAVEHLLTHKADPSIEDSDFMTAAEHAQEYGYTRIVEVLLEAESSLEKTK